ncbi:MAG TPA: methyltransferase [Isosphaeraceae bacterium]|jgi:predicted nicotinamide N-methyase|nr:methyltransferase [Isosphaeraceae bacterium]
METRYDGPVTLTRLEFGGKVVHVARPGDPDRLLNDPRVLELNDRDDYMPYWAYLWPGAYLLAEAVAREPWPGGDIEVLEIGCGVGLAGLVALACGLRVHFTDYDAAPLGMVARGASASGFDPSRYRASTLDWREPSEGRHPVILGADVLYERRLVPLVVGVIDTMLAPGGLALLAGPYRVATEDLPACLDAAGLRHQSTPIVATTEAGDAVRGTLYRVWRGELA